MVPNGALSYKLTWKKSGRLDNLDTFGWSQGVHNTQVPLYICAAIVIYVLYTTHIATYMSYGS